MFAPRKERYDKPIQSIKKQRCHFAEVHILKAMVLLVVMYRCELDHKESQMLKNGWFRTVVLEKTLESPLDCKENKPVNPKGNQPWIFIGRTDAEAKASQVLMVKNLPANPRDIRNMSSVLGWGRSPGRGHGNPLQYFFLENPMDREAWWATVWSIRSKKELALTEAT